LRGSPEHLTPTVLVPLAHTCIDAPARFLPLLGTAFETLTLWERMGSDVTAVISSSC
jgi:hypothetical protein